uniref:Uncharacterized protein n=1 Tax=Lotus japonicus TaxID=34305 RepID=I3SE80_LOTJA|nr:unknown [Lotus japonicus]
MSLFYVGKGKEYRGHQVYWVATCVEQHELLAHSYQQPQPYLKMLEWQTQEDCIVQRMEQHMV